MAGEKSNYQVISPLKHDGRLYTPVDGKMVTVALDQQEADVLRTLGVVSDLPPGAGEAEKDDKKGKPAK